MNPKRIEYSDHARRRLGERGITRQQVRWLLAKGIRTPVETAGATQYWICQGYLEKDEAAVIFLENAERILVVTVEWIW